MKRYLIYGLGSLLLIACTQTDNGSGTSGSASDDGDAQDVAESTEVENDLGDETDVPADEDGSSRNNKDSGPPVIRTPQQGCDNDEFLLPPGWTSLRIEPQNFSVTVAADESAKVDYEVIATLTGGGEKVLTEALFLVNNSGVGQLNGDGEFNSFPERGGKVSIQAMAGGGCIQTELTIITVYKEVVSGVEPLLPGWFDSAEEATTNPASPNMFYPLDGAAWPSNLPPMVMQWSYSFGGASSVFRLDFVAPYARVHVYGDHATWKHSTEKYAATIPAESWARIWKLLGGSPHKVSVVAAVNVGSGLAGGLLASAPRTIHFTDDQFGGAVYYWNTKTSGIRVLDLTPTPPTVESIPIEGGCHGCHAASPDGETIAVSFPSKKIDGSPGPPGSSKWVMSLHSVDSGAEVDWVHPAAKEFLGKDGTLFPAFSNSYWTEMQRHVVVTQGPFPVAGAGPPKRRLYSVDLNNGNIIQLTNAAQGVGDHQFFPALARNGQFLVFGDTDQSKMISAVGSSRLWRMEYKGGMGGDPEPLAGADLPDLLQYYPAITPDDKYVVFNRASSNTGDCAVVGGKGGPGSEGSYDNCHAELWLVPQQGGQAVRLDAASGPESAQYANSWPSMSDKVAGSHYWVAFSSRRPYGFMQTPEDEKKGSPPQIWVAAIDPAKIGTGVDPSFTPIWLSGQDLDGGNHIGQWSVR